MGYRYCPECEQWLSTSEYEVDDIGETVCPDHRATHGFIIDPPWSEQAFRKENGRYDDSDTMLRAAQWQGLVE